MATILDAGLLANIAPVFTFLFMLLATFALFNTTNILGKNGLIQWFSAFILAMLAATSEIATNTFQFAAPWLVMLFLVIIFVNMMGMFVGAKDQEVFVSPKNTPVMVIVAMLVIIIFFISLGQSLADKKQIDIDKGIIEEGETPTFGGRVADTIRHPAVLGLIIVLLIASAAVGMLTGPAK